MYKRAGVKGEGIMFLFTDSQIVDERMLVYINDLLSSGEIPDLFPQVCVVCRVGWGGVRVEFVTGWHRVLLTRMSATTDVPQTYPGGTRLWSCE
jgi:hypothetical protein